MTADFYPLITIVGEEAVRLILHFRPIENRPLVMLKDVAARAEGGVAAAFDFADVMNLFSIALTGDRQVIGTSSNVKGSDFTFV